jgi:dolichyl-phosphate-mannose-protein mannosyltransferase
MLTLETSILIAIIIASAAYVWRKSSSAKTAPILLDKYDKLIISLLSIGYALFSFIHLGSFQQFKTTWHGEEAGNQLNIQLVSPSKIGHIYYYSGINNGKYHWSDLNNANQEELINDPTANLGYPAHFKWNKIDLPVSDSLIQQINLTIDQAPLEIKQLAIFDTNNNYISNLKIKTNNSAENLSGLISSSAPQDYDDSFSSSTVFDEIFYATTAYQLLHGLDPYVAVHPPLGMLLIALGIAIFGMSAFGWRIIPDICSILLVPLIYIFAKRLFKTRRAAIISTILIMSECMHYTLGRLAFLDGIVTLFIILEYYYLYSY